MCPSHKLINVWGYPAYTVLFKRNKTLVQTSVNISIIFSPPPFPRVVSHTFWLKIPHYTPASSTSIQYRYRGRGIVGDFQSKCGGPHPGEGWGENYGNVDWRLYQSLVSLKKHCISRIPSYIYELMRRTHSGGFGIGQKYGAPTSPTKTGPLTCNIKSGQKTKVCHFQLIEPHSSFKSHN